jgi:RNA polymerase sigma-70 factor (ECF subfamily)
VYTVEVHRPVDTTRPSLLLRIRDRGDAAAWQVFDSIYRPMLHRFALQRGLTTTDAEDVTQHCLAAIADHIGAFDYDPRRGRFKGWLRTLVNNRVRNLLRDRREKQPATGAFDALADESPAPEDEFERIWMQEHLWFCLRELRGQVDAVTYQAFERHVLQQQPAEQVCRDLSITPGNLYTIRWRLERKVAARLKELLDDDA